MSQLLASRLPVTVSLSLGGAVLWLAVGIGVGVAAARRPRSLVDRGGAVLMLAGLSMPTFLVGLLLIYFLFFRLHLAGITWFPPGRLRPPGPGPRRVGPAPAAALGHPGCRDGGDLLAADAQLDAGGAGGGLHPHRPV